LLIRNGFETSASQNSVLAADTLGVRAKTLGGLVDRVRVGGRLGRRAERVR
jgi:hypothetical protein